MQSSSQSGYNFRDIRPVKYRVRQTRQNTCRTQSASPHLNCNANHAWDHRITRDSGRSTHHSLFDRAFKDRKALRKKGGWKHPWTTR